MFKKYELAAYVGEYRFVLLFQGYAPSFIRLFMRSFLLDLQDNLRRLVRSDSLVIKERLVPLFEEATLRILLQSGAFRMDEFPDTSCPPLRQVCICSDEGKSVPDFVEPFFSSRGLHVSVFNGMPSSWLERVTEPPLLIVLDSLFDAGGITFLNAFLQKVQMQIPIVYLSSIGKVEDLKAFFDELDYFETPFPLIVLMHPAS